MTAQTAPKNVTPSPEEPPDVAAFMAAVIAAPIEAELTPDEVATAMTPQQVAYARGQADDPGEPPTRALTVPRQHTNVGVGALAAMDDAAFEATLAQLTKGQERLLKLHSTLMVEKVDYGTVPGIPRPFLHKPGAEKLAQFYGLALRFEADRIVGKRALIRIGETETEMGEWLSPPLAYHVRAYAHLGDFGGPVVAQGYGEANVWEEKHRYRNTSPSCPECGHELIKRKSPPNLAGKWNCPNWGGKGGCNRVFEPNDERIKPAGKVENENPYDLANTLIKMAEKRAATDVVLRATNTSGLYSQDEDSPSVRAQSSGPPEEPNTEPPVERVEVAAVERGGKEQAATSTQIAEVAKISREKDLGPERIAEIIERVLGTKIDVGSGDRRTQGVALLAGMKALTADNLGKVLVTLLTGEVPDEPAVGEPLYEGHEAPVSVRSA